MAIAFPYLAATAGWILTEMGRQPWIVQGLLKTVRRRTRRTSSTAMVAISLAVFVALYAALGIVDFVLMRRYARVDPPRPATATARPRARAIDPAGGAY